MLRLGFRKIFVQRFNYLLYKLVSSILCFYEFLVLLFASLGLGNWMLPTKPFVVSSPCLVASATTERIRRAATWFSKAALAMQPYLVALGLQPVALTP